MTDKDRVAYTVTEAAEAAGVSEMTLRRAYRSGALTLRYPTSRPVVMKSDLEAWLAACPTEREASA